MSTKNHVYSLYWTAYKKHKVDVYKVMSTNSRLCSDKFTPYIFWQTMIILCDHEMFFGIGLLCMLFFNFFSLFELTVSAENC